MAQDNITDKEIDFGNEKIGRLFRSIFFPTLVGMVFMSLATIIDGVFTGRGVGAEGIAAVNIVAPLFMLMSGLGLMFGIGASVMASIKLAENNQAEARLILTQAFVVGFIITMVVIGTCFTSPRGVVYALGCSKLLEKNALDYMLWLAPGFLGVFWQCVGMMLIRLDGSPRYAMWLQVVSAVINIVLDWIFIFPLGWGVMGAGFATSIACFTAGIMALTYFIKFSSTLKFCRIDLNIKSAKKTLRNTWTMIKLGSSTFLSEVAMSVTMLAGNYMFMRLLHEDGVAAFAVACYLFPVIYSVNNSVAQAAQPIISYNYGAHNHSRVRQALHISMFTAMICGICVTAFLWFAAHPIVLMFLDPSATAFNLAVEGMPLFALCALCFAINVAAIGYYQSIAKPGLSAAYTALRGVIFSVPCLILLPKSIGVPGLWLAIPLAELLTLAVIAVVWVCRLKR